MITIPKMANDILLNGQADMVALGRAFLTNPRWVWDAANLLGEEIEIPNQYKDVLKNFNYFLFLSESKSIKDLEVFFDRFNCFLSSSIFLASSSDIKPSFSASFISASNKAVFLVL